jgi:hypothetical protein
MKAATNHAEKKLSSHNGGVEKHQFVVAVRQRLRQAW